MKLAILAVLALTGPALADPEPAPADRCARGAAFLAANDLSRASLYLDGCDTPAAADVQRKLRASKTLSSLSISTSPDGMAVEIDALPGEKIASPATVWLAPGTYKIHASTGDGRVLDTAKTLGIHERATVLLTAPPAHHDEPKAGKADFTDEPIDPAEKGDPPAVKHPSLLPCKYEGCDTHAGDLADPLAQDAEHLEPHPAARRIGLRAGVAAAGHAGGSRIGPSLALALRAAAPWEDTDAHRPFELELRPLDWSRRGGADAPIDVLGASLGIAKVVADPDAAWISVGVAVRGEVRFGGDAMDVRRFGAGGSAGIELALRKLPITVGARYEQGFTELVPGAHEHAVLVELGADLRAFDHAR